MLLLDYKRPLAASASQMSIVETSAAAKGKAPAEDSETEEEEEEELLLNKKKLTPPPKKGVPLPTSARSVSPEVDPGRAPGRIVGNTYPLKDFQKNISQGDVVTKAVEDLAAVITEVIMKPFASRRTQEMLECMEVLRRTCLEVRFFGGLPIPVMKLADGYDSRKMR